jgi:O-antigen/teichoic acid export membrane protein
MQKTEAKSWPLENDAGHSEPLRPKLHVAESSNDPIADSSGDPSAKRGGLWAALVRIVFGTHTLALADQAVFSGTSLLSTVLVGRWTVPSQLGIYTIGLSILGSLLAVQDALILLPYSIQRHHPSRTPAEHAGISLLHNGAFTVVACVALALAAAVSLAFGRDENMIWLIWALVFTVPFAMQREFGRGYAFSHLHVAKALILDVAVATLQLGALGWLGWTGQLSAVSACAALGGACALTSGVWLYCARSSFVIRADQVRQATRESWGLGKWLCAGQVTVSMQGYASYWLLPSLVGMTETGVYAACTSIASLANPLLTAFRNTLTPRAVLAFKEGGGAKLRRQAFRDALVLAGAMSLFCVTILVGGDTLMRAVYHGPEYGGQGHVVTVLAIAMMITATGAPASNALASMERPQAIVLATSVGTAVTVVAVWILSIECGLVGAAYGFLAGNVTGAAARWIAFLAVLARSDSADCDHAPVVKVLQELTQDVVETGWDIRSLGEGFHGKIYAVVSQGNMPLWQGHRDLVVKLYKPDGPAGADAAKRQFDAQMWLHSAVDGKTAGGWKTRAPLPLYVSASPPALVMTLAAGTNLDKSLANGSDPPPEMLDSAARAIVAVMRPYWAAGRLHGDLSLHNILWDPSNHVLSLIDVDTSAGVSVRDGFPKEWYPASLDLAGILYDVGTDIRTADRRVLSRKRMFAESVLLAFLTTVGAPEEKRRLVEEVRAFARAELEALDVPWSPRGLYRLLQRDVATRRIDRLLVSVEATMCARSRLAIVGEDA